MSYVLGSYSARKLGLQSTANAGGVHNLHVSHGTADQAELIRQMGTGFLVTEMMGQGTNLVTGDYSRGAGGFWIENGEIQFPSRRSPSPGGWATCSARSWRWASDVERRGSLRTGSVLIDGMTLAGS